MLRCFWFLHQIRYFESGDRFDHFGQQQPIAAIRRQVRNLLLRFRPLQIIVGPVRVDLWDENKKKNRIQSSTLNDEMRHKSKTHIRKSRLCTPNHFAISGERECKNSPLSNSPGFIFSPPPVIFAESCKISRLFARFNLVTSTARRPSLG